ncbi:PREDICTED: leukotriene B4 receptor 1-like [Cyprinodon variegatus]|uniref:leukotriene B4 receptor 1-like n=1 Tax=Cyprinodon variegatus TaxID=28743 RepID=UPI000742C88C|nr:PREDICTED: leukotriene B4 receptor 1-like [Cyprinodon variegatus]
MVHSQNPIHTEEEDSSVSNDYATAIGALILSLVFLLGVPGNLFIVWSILARTRKRSVTTILILNLACADGLLMALTIFFIIYLAKQSWIFGSVLCKGLFYLCNANMYASIFLITLMSVHRMVAVLFPQKLFLITRKIVIRVILGMWVLVMVIAIPSLVFRELEEEPDGNTTKTRTVCAPNHTIASHFSFLSFFSSHRLDSIHQSCRAVTSALAFISSCANPVLYTFAGKSYIKKNGFAFMAKLFEGTSSSDQSANKMSRVISKDSTGYIKNESINNESINIANGSRI